MVGTEALKVSKLLQRLLPSLSIPVAHPCISIPIPAETCPTLQALSRAPENASAASAQILWAQSFESLLRACVLGFHSSDPRLGKAGCVQREAGDEGRAPHCGFSLKSHSVVLVVAGRSSQRAIKGAHELCGKCQALVTFIHNSNSHIPAAVPMDIPCRIWPESRTPPVEMLQSSRSVAVAVGCVASLGKLNTGLEVHPCLSCGVNSCCEEKPLAVWGQPGCSLGIEESQKGLGWPSSPVSLPQAGTSSAQSGPSQSPYSQIYGAASVPSP